MAEEPEPFISHVYPLGDLFPHNTVSRDCPCHPRVIAISGYGEIIGKIIVHNAWDRREVYEKFMKFWKTYGGFPGNVVTEYHEIKGDK